MKGTKEKIFNQMFSLLVDSYLDRFIVATNHHFKDKELNLFNPKGTPFNEKHFTLTILAKEKKARIKSIEFDVLVNNEDNLRKFSDRVTYDIDEVYREYAEKGHKGFLIHQSVWKLKMAQLEGFLNRIKSIANGDSSSWDDEEWMTQLQNDFRFQPSADYSAEDIAGRVRIGSAPDLLVNTSDEGVNMRILYLKEVFIVLTKKRKKDKKKQPV